MPYVVILRPLFRVRTISYKVKPQISRWPFSKRQGLPTNNQKMFHLKYFRNIFFHSFEALENRFLLWKCIFGDNSIQMMIISSLMPTRTCFELKIQGYWRWQQYCGAVIEFWFNLAFSVRMIMHLLKASNGLLIHMLLLIYPFLPSTVNIGC